VSWCQSNYEEKKPHKTLVVSTHSSNSWLPVGQWLPVTS
jgi:hypothetical protein